jgi:predicted flavoprotein YhiN
MNHISGEFQRGVSVASIPEKRRQVAALQGTDEDLVVVGAGAAGLLAAARAAERGLRTLVLEKNRKPGVKILMSGGTRCNLTHATDARGIVEAFGRPGRFLHSALARLSPQDLVEIFRREGLRTKVEPTGKIFPASDRALDVLGALLARFKRSGAVLACEEPVLEVGGPDSSGFRLVTPRRSIRAANLLLTTGGRSYPRCGTTGDGYAWAAAWGHAIVPPRPALVPLRTDAAWVTSLTGLTVPDVLILLVGPACRAGPCASATSAGHAGPFRQKGPTKASPGTAKVHLAECRGSFLFTHFGLSGPAVLNVSREVSGHPHPETLCVVCDFLPSVPEPELEALLARQCAAAGKRQLVSIVLSCGAGVPPATSAAETAAPQPGIMRRLAEAMIRQAGLDPERRAAEIGKADRHRLLAAIKRLAIPISGSLGFQKAEVTAGGVSLEEVDSRSMQSKRVPRLFFAGEILDIDGPIGGYNFQAAFSTGYLAAESVTLGYCLSEKYCRGADCQSARAGWQPAPRPTDASSTESTWRSSSDDVGAVFSRSWAPPRETATDPGRVSARPGRTTTKASGR